LAAPETRTEQRSGEELYMIRTAGYLAPRSNSHNGALRANYPKLALDRPPRRQWAGYRSLAHISH
jgi:hypothetical protein